MRRRLRPIHARLSLRWCPGEDSNLHGLPHRYLKPARLPIPPPGPSDPWRVARRGAFCPERAQSQPPFGGPTAAFTKAVACHIPSQNQWPQGHLGTGESMQRLATVFGGSGFIGRYVVTNLARAGWLVRVAVRRPDEALFLKTAGVVGQVTPVAANVRDRASVARAVAGADAVVNLVGILHEGGPQKFEAVQAEGAKAIAEEAARAGARHLVQISAIGADANSDSAYARTKAAGEAAVRQAFPDATILRPSIVFGPEDGFFNRFARMAQLAPALPLIGGGKTRFQPVYVGDIAAAVVKAIETPEAAGQTYELAGPKIY